MKNISAGNATSHNDLFSDQKPVFFEVNLNTSLAAFAKKFSITNWKAYYEIIYNSIPGNPKMGTTEEVDDCISKFTCFITTTINLSTKVQLIKGHFRQLPQFILDKKKIKNRLRKLYQQTFYPPFKLQKQIHKDIEDFDNNRWRETIQGINSEDNTLYDMNRKLSNKFIPTPPILDTDGMKYMPLGKANAFRYSLENSFQENPEPYCNSHISKVNLTINKYLRSLNTCSPPNIISPQEVINLIKKINPRKATGPDGVPNKAPRMLTLNAVTHLTKIFKNVLLSIASQHPGN
ncbi:hypothetical protein AVEN_41317-1 [Araneus ventricosus]|uniref:RNA-directed DNA polymerase from transposon X-element n=1 Tax=Araneus ventricosus TaxID=182803 RepID=A0A4Y2SFN9_ARAVE|nr:hypothetical protein AVEN_41317-1 [Araneus ventricosus]